MQGNFNFNPLCPPPASGSTTQPKNYLICQKASHMYCIDPFYLRRQVNTFSRKEFPRLQNMKELKMAKKMETWKN